VMRHTIKLEYFMKCWQVHISDKLNDLLAKSRRGECYCNLVFCFNGINLDSKKFCQQGMFICIVMTMSGHHEFQ